MKDPNFTPEEFRTLAPGRLILLEEMGFHRAASLEEISPVGSSLVYLGNHVGFIFGFDVRDQTVHPHVVKVRDGQIARNWEGGYSAGLLGHLANHAGYRGRLGGTTDEAGRPALEAMIDRWVDLLRESAQSLLSDQPDSLPR